MLSWLVDNALLLYLLLGCVLLAVGASWWMTRKRQYLLAVGGVAGLIFLVWLLTRLVVTDRGQIEHNIRAMADAVGANRPANVVKHLAGDFRYQGLTKASIGPYIQSAVRRAGLQEVRVTEINITRLERSQRRAEAEFKVFVFAEMFDAGAPYWCKGEFVLEQDDWRLQTVRIFPGFVNTDKEIHIPLP